MEMHVPVWLGAEAFIARARYGVSGVYPEPYGPKPRTAAAYHGVSHGYHFVDPYGPHGLIKQPAQGHFNRGVWRAYPNQPGFGVR